MIDIRVVFNIRKDIYKSTEKTTIYLNFNGSTVENPHEQSPQSLLLLKDKLTKEEAKQKQPSFYMMNDVRLGVQKLSNNMPLKKRISLYQNYHIKNEIHCEYCEQDLKIEEATIDHYVPLSRSGLDDLSNYKIACKACNSIKTSIHPVQDYNVFKIFKSYVYKNKKKYQQEFIKMVLSSEISYKEFKNFVFNTKISFSSEQVTVIIDKLVEYSNSEKFKELYSKNPKATEILSSYKIQTAIDNDIEFKNIGLLKSFAGEIQ
jgi:hypothetical protein